MKMKRNSILSLVAVLFVIYMGMFMSTVPATAADDDVYEVDWYCNIPWYNWDHTEDSLLARMIRDKFGIKINLIKPADNSSQMLNTMIASGDLPDVITMESWLSQRSKLANAGMLYSLDNLIDKYDPSFRDILRMDIYNWYKEADGETYSLPNWAYSRYDLEEGEKLIPNGAFVLRSDIFKQIPDSDKYRNEDGIVDVTPDEYLKILEYVKNNIKDYKGLDIIPMQLADYTDRGNMSMNWFEQYFSVPFETANGDLAFQLPEEYQVYKFLNEAYRKNLMSAEAFSQNREQINNLVATGRVFALHASPQDFNPSLKSLYDYDNNAVYEPFILRNYKSERPYLSDISGFGWLTTSISKNAKHPEKIIKLFEWLYSKEGQFAVQFGKEGVTYNIVDGKVVWTDEFKKAQENNAVGKKYGLYFDLLANYLVFKDYLPEPTAEEKNYVADIIKEPLKKYTYDGKMGALKTDPTDPRQDEMQKISTKLDLYWGKQLVKIIMADSEEKAHQIFEDTRQKMINMGAKKLWEYNNEAFQRAKEALGVEYAWPPYRK